MATPDVLRTEQDLLLSSIFDHPKGKNIFIPSY